ncbi:hypothetical protein NEMBOFW57_007002 [Staphylotrichum longicolle]|uniref:Uncharacterized protein n=1 Tax=Staphylotrichum longicolle TaxID=669026 RepID=A0AAD4HYL5_9PEZI|nr:hypothetical protein NEMBOFW57_007002 [Staphylotrichum longicolle]
MTKLTDLKFFLPAFEPILAKAYKKMTRVDYLLTAALLCKTREWSPVFELEHDIGLLRELKFKRYTGRVNTNDYGGNVPLFWANIYLDGKEVGTWADMPDQIGLITVQCLLRALPRAEQIVRTALGMIYTESSGFDVDRRTKTIGGLYRENDDSPLSGVEIVEMDLF